MRLLTFRGEDGTHAGRLENDRVVELPFSDVSSLIASGQDWREAASADGPERNLSDISYAPLVTRPPAVICVGQNYAAHVAEVRVDLPAYPTLFAKFPSSLLGAYDDLVLPAVSTSVDWEVELAFVVGVRGRNLSEAEASHSIAGYTIANDVSMRDFQARTSQFLQGKAFEASTPVGPVLLTPEEFPGESVTDLRLTCEVDGVVVQDGTTADMIFTPPVIAAYISQIMTLEPGMLILTGTPDGIGAARTPPIFLREGQTMRTTVERIGKLENHCVGE
jgi:acylpyruvate hydrolase